MKVSDIGSAAQSLADYCCRKGEAADLDRLDGAVRLLGQRVTVLKQDRISAMVDMEAESSPLGEVLGG